MAKHKRHRGENRQRYERCVRQAAEYPYLIVRFNKDQQWRVDIDGTSFDFWPSTGVFMTTRTQDGIRGQATDFVDFCDQASALVVAA